MGRQNAGIIEGGVVALLGGYKDPSRELVAEFLDRNPYTDFLLIPGKREIKATGGEMACEILHKQMEQFYPNMIYCMAPNVLWFNGGTLTGACKGTVVPDVSLVLSSAPLKSEKISGHPAVGPNLDHDWTLETIVLPQTDPAVPLQEQHEEFWFVDELHSTPNRIPNRIPNPTLKIFGSVDVAKDESFLYLNNGGKPV